MLRHRYHKRMSYHFYNLKMQIKIRKMLKALALVPEKENIDYTYDGETLEFTIPCVSGHSMVEIQY